MEQRSIRLDGQLGALADVALGKAARAARPTPLPAIGSGGTTPGLVLHSAVLADPATLQRPNDKALAAVKIGPFRLAVTLNNVEHGKGLVVGQRLYLPVEARDTARLDYAGRR